MQDKEDIEEVWRARGYIVLAPDDVHEKVIAWLDQMPNCRLIFTKTSHRKRLVLVEEGY
jgi:hypothetical protein